ncbi:MAG TPA: RNA polymerase sigma-70 factor [Chitinophagaceae bacterium]|nr:RNA polymerase sigma-70 factor [Chitinophagaceae bacterium]
MNLTPPYEKRLLARIAEGDEAALKTIFECYRGKVYRYIYRITKSREEAEEIVMDVFLKIWLNREMASEIDHFDAFLFRVAQNKAIDFLRLVARRPALHKLVWEEIQLAADNTTDSGISAREYETKIHQAIARLSPQRQLVYQLSREQGLSHDQIAVHLKLSKNTIKNHMVESMRFIKGYLNAHTEMIVIACFVPFLPV